MTMTKDLRKLVRSLEDSTASADAVLIIRRIARTQDPDAIRVLAGVLDTPGPVGAAAVRGLVSFGQFAETEMRRVVARSMDEDAIRNAHRVLAALGDGISKRAVSAACWADLEDEVAREEASAAAARTAGPSKAG